MSKKYTKNYPYGVGIDLGTSNSCIAVKVGNEIKVIEAKEGVSKQGKTLASCVSFIQSGDKASEEILVGDFAKNRLVIAPEETIYQAKRHMGTDKTWVVRGKTYRPEQIAAYIISKLKTDVESQLEANITDAVITVPAQFNDLQRKATEDAAKIAGINCLRLINEPTAAALAYDFKDLTDSQHILVADLGGGTFDVSILQCEKSVFTVVATGGDTKLGGKDIDDIMIAYTVKEIEKNYAVVVGNNHDMLEKIRSAVEETKITLSNVLDTQLIIPFLGLVDNKPISISLPYSRLLLEQQIKPVLEAVERAIISTIKDSNLSVKQINKLLLVGGPMNMPIVRKAIEQIVGISASTSLNPNNCVAIGAARQAAVLTGTETESSKDEILLLDVTPLSLGVAVEGNVMSKIIEKNAHIPIKNVMRYTTAEDNQQSVEIRILQGERPMASDNKLLNTFNLKGIPKMKRGQPIIEVTFEIDASGILSVHAEETTTKVSQSVTVVNNKNLSQSEIDRMVKEAEENRERDEKKRAIIEATHKGKSIIYSLEEAKTNDKLVLSTEDVNAIDTIISELNVLITDCETEKVDIATIDAKTKEAENLLVKILQDKTKMKTEGEKGSSEQTDSATTPEVEASTS